MFDTLQIELDGTHGKLSSSHLEISSSFKLLWRTSLSSHSGARLPRCPWTWSAPPSSWPASNLGLPHQAAARNHGLRPGNKSLPTYRSSPVLRLLHLLPADFQRGVLTKVSPLSLFLDWFLVLVIPFLYYPWFKKYYLLFIESYQKVNSHELEDTWPSHPALHNV